MNSVPRTFAPGLITLVAVSWGRPVSIHLKDPAPDVSERRIPFLLLSPSFMSRWLTFWPPAGLVCEGQAEVGRLRWGRDTFNTAPTAPPACHIHLSSALVSLLPLFLHTGPEEPQMPLPSVFCNPSSGGGGTQRGCLSDLEEEIRPSLYLHAQYGQTINTACVHISWQSNVAINTNTDTPSRNVSVFPACRDTHMAQL